MTYLGKGSSYQFILFDLDGTLTDPGEGIANSVRYALKRYGIVEADDAVLKKFIGPPLHLSFSEFYAFDEVKAKEAVAYYREYFAQTGIFENRLIDGIPELLAGLQQKGKTLLVASSKPTVFVEKILSHFSLAVYFTHVVGSNLDGTRTDKAEVVQYALCQLGQVARGQAVMVGDRKHDVMGAKANGIDSVGVTFGYGSVEEMAMANPTYIVHRVDELRDLFHACDTGVKL